MSIRFWLHLLRPTPRTPEPAPEPAPGPVRPLGEPDQTPDPVTLRLLHEGLQAWEPPQPEPEPDPPPERTGDLHPDSSRSVRHQIALDNIYGPGYGPDHESEPAR